MSLDQIVYIAVVIYSIVLHEVAHGYVAKLCGDKTAFYAGRLTLNPIQHIDPVGSLLVPTISVLSGGGAFGWAKGVPVNLTNLNSKWKEFAVSVAGIATNLSIALLFIMLIKFGIGGNIYQDLFLKITVVNIGLGFFNLLPIPPFDGMSILRSFFPALKHKYQAFEHNPAVMLITVLVASYLFSFIYPSVLNTIFNIFF